MARTAESFQLACQLVIAGNMVSTWWEDCGGLLTLWVVQHWLVSRNSVASSATSSPCSFYAASLSPRTLSSFISNKHHIDYLASTRQNLYAIPYSLVALRRVNLIFILLAPSSTPLSFPKRLGSAATNYNLWTDFAKFGRERF